MALELVVVRKRGSVLCVPLRVIAILFLGIREPPRYILTTYLPK